MPDGIQAIQFDQTPNQLLYKMAEDLRQEKRIQEQMKREDDVRKFNVLSTINPNALYKDFDKQVVDASISGLQQRVAEYLKSNPTTMDLQSFIQNNVGDIAQWSAKTTAIRTGLESQVQKMNNKAGIDVDTLFKKTIQNALYDQNGQLKSAKDLDPSKDWITETYAASPKSFTDMQQVGGSLLKSINDAPKKTTTVDVTTQRGKVINVEKKSLEYSPAFQQVNTATGNIEFKKKDGYLDESAYNYFVQPGSPMEGYLENQVDRILDSYNKDKSAQNKLKIGSVDISDPGNRELIKRAWLTNYVESTAGSKQQDVTKDIVKPPSINIFNQPTTADPNFVSPTQRIKEIVSLNDNFLGKKETSGQGNIRYTVTDQFKELPLFKSIGTGKTYGPSEVVFLKNIKGGEDQFIVREKPGKPLKVYTVTQWNDFIDGTYIDPSKGKVRGVGR